MRRVLKIISVWITVFLLMSCLQMMFQAMAVGTVYNFEDYYMVDWIFQSLYWLLSFSFSATIALNEDDRL